MSWTSTSTFTARVVTFSPPGSHSGVGRRVWRRLMAGAALGVLAATAVVAAVARRGGLFADRPPGPVEAFVARRLVWLSIPASQASARNPFAGDPAAWRAASPLFKGHCAGCHAADGHGQTAIGPHLYPPVPDLADPAVQRL